MMDNNDVHIYVVERVTRIRFGSRLLCDSRIVDIALAEEHARQIGQGYVATHRPARTEGTEENYLYIHHWVLPDLGHVGSLQWSGTEKGFVPFPQPAKTRQLGTGNLAMIRVLMHRFQDDPMAMAELKRRVNIFYGDEEDTTPEDKEAYR